jgi:hypothetical protein
VDERKAVELFSTDPKLRAAQDDPDCREAIMLAVEALTFVAVVKPAAKQLVGMLDNTNYLAPPEYRVP